MYDNYIRIPPSRIKKFIKAYSNFKFGSTSCQYVASIVCLMAHEIIEIIVEKTLEHNVYTSDLFYLSLAMKDPILLNSILTSALFTKPDNIFLGKMFVNYIHMIRKDVIQEFIVHPSDIQIRLSKQLKMVISAMIHEHLLKLLDLINHYMVFSSKKVVNQNIILTIYSLWMKTMNTPDEIISVFHKVIELKIDDLNAKNSRKNNY